MQYGPYTNKLKAFDSTVLEDGVYCEFFNVACKDYTYFIVRDKEVVLELNYCSGQLTWASPYKNGKLHGIKRFYIIAGREVCCIKKLFINGIDYTELAKEENIDFDSDAEISFMVLKYT